MKLSEYFKQAAAKINLNPSKVESGALCCCEALRVLWAGSLEGILRQEQAITFLTLYFKPKNTKLFWWDNPLISSRHQQARVLALLLAAEIAKSEGL